MIKRLLVALIGVGAILLVLAPLGYLKYHAISSKLAAFAAYKPPPQTVSATAAKQLAWRKYSPTIGTLSAVKGVDVSSELAGKIVSIAFESGDDVQQGQLLVQLDDRQEQALLRQYQAQEALDKTIFERATALRKRNLNSRQDLDNAREQYKMAQAQVAQERAVIAKKTIRAPFSGITGIRQVNLGQYVTAGQAIVNLEQLDPLYLTFTLPQAQVSSVHLGQDIAIHVDAYPGREFTGKVTAINPAVNDQSRALQAQATVPNNDRLLRPGMFADVKVLADTGQKVTVVPATAISYSLYGDSVYVLTPTDGEASAAGGAAGNKAANAKSGSSTPANGASRIYTAKQVFVKTGEQRGDLVAVTGINPGTLVVTAGQIKLHSGSTATINNSADLSKLPELTP